MSRCQLRPLNNLIHIEAVHEIRRLTDVDGARQAALWETEMVHAARVVAVCISEKCDRTAISVESGTCQQRKPTIPLMGDSRGLDLQSKASYSPEDLSELREALSLLKPADGKVKISYASVPINAVKGLFAEASLTSDPKGLPHFRVWLAKGQRNMILAARVGQNSSSKHELTRWLQGNDGS
jgi:hypothetical protein